MIIIIVIKNNDNNDNNNDNNNSNNNDNNNTANNNSNMTIISTLAQLVPKAGELSQAPPATGRAASTALALDDAKMSQAFQHIPKRMDGHWAKYS